MSTSATRSVASSSSRLGRGGDVGVAEIDPKGGETVGGQALRERDDERVVTVAAHARVGVEHHRRADGGTGRGQVQVAVVAHGAGTYRGGDDGHR